MIIFGIHGSAKKTCCCLATTKNGSGVVTTKTGSCVVTTLTGPDVVTTETVFCLVTTMMFELIINMESPRLTSCWIITVKLTLMETEFCIVFAAVTLIPGCNQVIIDVTTASSLPITVIV